ncbi:MAG: DUF4232 domain-containing protein [Brevundimonas sp.]|nr:MAG: DUF4232 domain-containing protein [Brevundimonas sp.]
MKRHAAVVLTSGLMALAACNRPAETPPTVPAAAPAPIQISYTCESGQNVAVDYPNPTTAELTYQGKTHTLNAITTASGARYVGTELEWATAVRDGAEGGVLTRVPARAEDKPVVVERCSRPAPDVAPPKPDPAPVTPGLAGAVNPPCVGPQLKLSADGGDAGMGHRVAILGVQNVGTRACSLSGYATVGLQDRQGRDLTAIRPNQATGSYLRSGERPTPVELAPQAKAFFDIAWTVVPHEADGETVCPSATRVRVTAPGDTSPLSLDQTFTPCGGKIDVTPFRAEAEPTVTAPEPVV